MGGLRRLSQSPRLPLLKKQNGVTIALEELFDTGDQNCSQNICTSTNLRASLLVHTHRRVLQVLQVPVAIVMYEANPRDDHFGRISAAIGSAAAVDAQQAFSKYSLIEPLRHPKHVARKP